MSTAAGRRRTRGWSIAAALLVMLVPGAVSIGPAAAGEPPAGLKLVAQDPWTFVGGSLNATLRVDGAAAGAGFTISVIAHQALDSRGEFDRSLDGEDLGSVSDSVDVPLDTLPVDANGNRTLEIGLEQPNLRRVELLRARRSGVYPLEIELRDADEQTQAGLVTYLPVVEPFGSPPTVSSPLGVAWVWPLNAAPAQVPGASLDPAVLAQLEPDGRIGRQVAALERAGGVPVSLVPGPETLQTWEEVAKTEPLYASGVATLKSAFGTSQTIANTYVPVNLPSLLRAGMTSAVDSQLIAGNEALNRFFGTRLDARTAVARPVDAATLARLVSGAVDRVVVDSSALVPRSNRLTTTRPFALTNPAGDPMMAVASDTGLAALLSGDGSPALRVQRMLAGLSVVALEDPTEARAVAIVNPADFKPSDEVLDAVLAGLRGNPWLRPMTVDTVFEQVPAETTADGTAVTRELVAYEPPAPPVTPGAYEAARTRLAALHDFAPETPDIDTADHALLASVSSTWNTLVGPARAAAELASIDNVINALVAKIDVPTRSTITLTDRSGDIPLTFRNATDQTVSVLVQFESPKLSFPDGVQQVIKLPPKNTTVRFAVVSRTSGSFPLQLTISSADGRLPIAQTEFEVRATAVSAVGLVLIISALAFLTLWWMFHIRRDRHRRRVAAHGAVA